MVRQKAIDCGKAKGHKLWQDKRAQTVARQKGIYCGKVKGHILWQGKMAQTVARQKAIDCGKVKGHRLFQGKGAWNVLRQNMYRLCQSKWSYTLPEHKGHILFQNNRSIDCFNATGVQTM